MKRHQNLRTLGLIKKNSINLAKQTINLDSVNVHQIEYPTNLSIVMIDGFKYYIGNKEGDIVETLCIILPQMRGYIKYFENRGKNMSLLN